MATKTKVREMVESNCGKNWTKRDAAIDSIWWSLQNGRPRDEAIRGLANATTCGIVPSHQDLCQAEELYEKVRKEVA